MKNVAISTLTAPISTWNPRKLPEDYFHYVDLSSIANDAKVVATPRQLLGIDAPGRARQILNANDVLVSNVRPNLNAVALVPAELDGSTASTGFTVLRATTKLEPRYLFHWVRSPRFVGEMVKQATGASYPAVSARIVKDSHIPLPTIKEQIRIAKILDHADAIRQKRLKALESLLALKQSIFIELFGNPITNERKFPLVRLGDLGNLDRGISRHRPRNDPKLYGGPYPFIQTGDVSNSSGHITDYVSTYSEFGLNQSKIWPSGTLCITIAANIAKTGVLQFDACFPDSVVGFTAEPEEVSFVAAWLSFLQPILEAQAPQSAQKNINLSLLRQLTVPLPSGKEITRFHQLISRLTLQVEKFKTLIAKDDELYSSLQSVAFRGELK